MEFQDVLTRRRSVRTYSDRPVPRDVLERIANAAVVWAPSAGFSQGLRIVVVTDPETRRTIATAAMEDDLAAKGRPRWKAAAPVHMVVLTREDDYHDRYRSQDKLKITGGREIDWPAPYWYVDAGAAAMALMLAAIDEGLDTAIFGVTDLATLHEALGLPDDVLFVAVVTMGYPEAGRRRAERSLQCLHATAQATGGGRALGAVGLIRSPDVKGAPLARSGWEAKPYSTENAG